MTISFSEEVTVSGAPQLELDLGGEAKTATYDFTGDSTAVFAYVVQEGDADTDGIAIDADTLSLGTTTPSRTAPAIQRSWPTGP